MEKNIAALMREDTRTVEVVFSGSGQHYTYITDVPLEPGDFVVVYARGELKVVEVVCMHDSVQIAPGRAPVALLVRRLRRTRRLRPTPAAG